MIMMIMTMTMTRDAARRKRKLRERRDGDTHEVRTRYAQCNAQARRRAYGSPRAPETLLTNAERPHRTHSLVSTRARHSTQRSYGPRTGGDDTSRAHQPGRHSRSVATVARPTNRQAVSGGRPAWNPTRTELWVRLQNNRGPPRQTQRIRSVDGGPSSGPAGSSRDCLCVKRTRARTHTHAHARIRSRTWCGASFGAMQCGAVRCQLRLLPAAASYFPTRAADRITERHTPLLR